MMSGAGACVVIKASPVCSPCSQMRLIPADHIYRHTCSGLGLAHPSPKVDDAQRCCRLFLHTTCQSPGRKRLLAGPTGASAVLHMWGTNWRTCMSCMHILTYLHTLVPPPRAIISDMNPQWGCLDYTELSWWNVSPTKVPAFISIPVPLLLPFVRVIYTAVYAHTTCKARCSTMQRECNVGHQTEPTGRALLFVSGEAASRVKDWCESRGVKKQQKQKKKKEGKKHNGTNKSFFDKLLKRRVRLFWVLSLVDRGMEIRKHCFLSLPLLPSHALWWIVYVTYLLLTSAVLSVPLSPQHEIALKTMLEFLITWIVKLKHCFELINNTVWSF